jgi:FAD/FMN-containing dehydrogenase
MSKRPTWIKPAAALQRRDFVRMLGAASAGFALPGAADPAPFGSGIDLYREDYENWSEELQIPCVLAFTPRSPQDAVDAANWAATNSYTLRPRGAAHGWSPLTLAFSTTAQTKTLLAETRGYLNRMEIAAGPVPAVRVEAGATLDALQAFLEANGYGFTATPAVGNITVGGALAINGHGASTPALGETRGPGQTYGSLCNRILALKAIVWSSAQNSYVLQSFNRSDPAIRPLLCHLGRAFITEVTLAVEPNFNLLCQSTIDIPASELFADPNSGARRTLASFLDQSGRLEVIWYSFTEYPWLKVWTPTPRRPLLARAVTQPYNYPFSDQLPKPLVDLARSLVTGAASSAPAFGQASYDVTAAGLLATAGYSIWGPSKNTLFYVRPTTIREHEAAVAVVTARSNVQRVVADYYTQFVALRDRYRAHGLYPVNMPVEIRVTGLDRPQDFGYDAAQVPLLSTAAPCAARPDWDSVVWLSTLSLPGTPSMFPFFRELERGLRARFNGGDGLLRPEWSKGWAYTNTAAWQDAETLTSVFPTVYDGWNEALARLHAFDPKGIYSNAFLQAMTGT